MADYTLDNPFRIKLKPRDRVFGKIVAVIGSVGDWAAYVGPNNWSDEMVAKSGIKLSESTARELFESLIKWI